MKTILHLSLVLVVMVLASQVVRGAPINSLFDPNDYASLGVLNPTTSVAFDTNALTVTIDGGSPIAAVSDVSQSGLAQIAIYNFNSINLNSGVTVTVTGDRGLGLLSLGGATIGTTMNLSGSNAASNVGAIGNAGSEGGVTGSGVSNSAPPPATAGDGGSATGGGSSTNSGVGLGGGIRAVSGGNGASKYGGGGGAFGGAGGKGGTGNASSGNAGNGGAVYGDAALTNLFGGSGGGSGSGSGTPSAGGGGGGGGSLYIAATTSIALTSTANISVAGGNGFSHLGGGGGGSGGGILFAADSIVLDAAAIVDATGGDGGMPGGTSNRGPGGGGGGGRVAFYSNDDLGSIGENQIEVLVPAEVLLSGGAVGVHNGTPATVGSIGTFYDGGAPVFAVPEPSTVLLSFVGMALCLSVRRRNVA